MKFIDIPYTHDDMRFSLSMTGITELKQTRYFTRHSGSREIVQVPGKGFILKKHDRSTKPKKYKPKKRQNSPDHTTVKNFIATQKVKQYTVNKKEVIHRIRNYVNQMKGEKFLYFWTVSFPVNTSDQIAYILLNKWLTRLRQEKLLKEYIWIAERQENGTIHFHMVINRKLCVKKANKYMRASIMWSINKGEIDYSREAATRYNGVDIAKDRKTKRVTNFAKQNKQKSLTNYLTKYVTKNDTSFQNLAWHSSREYSNLIIAVRFTPKEISESNILSLTNQESILEGEYYKFYKWKGKPPNELLNYLSQLNHGIISLLNQ